MERPELHPLYLDFLVRLANYIDSLKGDGRIDERQLSLVSPQRFPASLARAAINELIGFEFVYRAVDTSSALLSRADTQRVFIELTHKGALAVHSARFGEATTVGVTIEQVSDWVPLQLERDSAAAADALGSLDQLAERVRGENGFASSDPECHAAITWSLSTGIDALRSRAPSKQQITALIVAPTKWLIEKFAGSAIGELAKRAASALANWLGWPQ